MQLKQKHTINNITYENEIFIYATDNIDINKTISHFFKIDMMEKAETPVPTKDDIKNKISQMLAEDKREKVNKYQREHRAFCGFQKDIRRQVAEKIAKRKYRKGETFTKVKENAEGYYAQYRIEKEIIEKWTGTTKRTDVIQNLYKVFYKKRIERGYENLDCEIVQIKPMSLAEFNARS